VPAWRLGADTLLVTMLVGAAVTIAAVTAVNVADVFFTRETLHASTTTYGLLGATWTATMLIGAWLAARAGKRVTDGRLAVTLLVLLGATSVVILACASAQHVLWLFPLFVIGGVFNGGENVIANLVIARRVPAAVRGRAIGAFVGTINAANVIGFLLGGLLLGVFTPRTVLALAGLAGLLAVAACVPPMLRAVRREAPVTNTTPEPAVAPIAG
jgi:MFS family permease